MSSGYRVDFRDIFQSVNYDILIKTRLERKKKLRSCDGNGKLVGVAHCQRYVLVYSNRKLREPGGDSLEVP